MKKNKGFTLVELLAVIVILGIILSIATGAVLDSIEKSKYRARYIAASDLLEIAKAYISAEPYEDCITEHANGSTLCVKVSCLINKGYVSEDATNPRNGENSWPEITSDSSPFICYYKDSGLHSNKLTSKNDYKPEENAECGNTFAKVGADSWAYYFEEGYYRFGTKETAQPTCGYRYGNIDKSGEVAYYEVASQSDCDAISNYISNKEDFPLDDEQKILADIDRNGSVELNDVNVCECIAANSSSFGIFNELSGNSGASELYNICRNEPSYRAKTTE